MRSITSNIMSAVLFHRLRFGTEADLHDDVARLLTNLGIHFVRELRLTAEERIDFYLPDSMIGIECKVDGGPTAVASQLLRYAESKDIAELLLITSKRSHMLSVDELSGKPVRCLWIGGSSL